MTRNSYAKWCFLGFVYVLASLLFTQIYMTNTFEFDGATLELLTNFKAERPYQYRILVPAIARLMQVVTKLEVVSIYFTLTLASTVGVLFGFRSYLRQFIPEEAANLGTLAIIYPMLWNLAAFCNWRFFYPFDVPTILFFVLALTSLAKKRWIAFYVIFILASINRETSFFLSVIYLVTSFSKDRIKSSALHLALQVAIWSGIYFTLRHQFSDNPGNPFDLMWWRNLEMWKTFATLQFNEGIFAMLSMCGFIWLLIPLQWNALPQFLKLAMLICIPFWASMFVVANLDELRIYCELIPILTAPAVFSLWKGSGFGSVKVKGYRNKGCSNTMPKAESSSGFLLLNPHHMEP